MKMLEYLFIGLLLALAMVSCELRAAEMPRVDSVLKQFKSAPNYSKASKHSMVYPWLIAHPSELAAIELQKELDNERRNAKDY